MKKINIGIVGSAGYTGGELIRLLINHPAAHIAFAHSQSQAGKYVYQVHTDLLGDTDLKFSAETSEDIDVLFLCVGHGNARKYLEANPVADHIRIIDLSQDFRNDPNLEFPAGGGQAGGARHFVYGLPELNREAIKTARNIANPGCFATGIQLALLPLAAAGVLNNDVHLTATTGSTGAGQAPSPTTHFSWRSNNLSVYKPFGHQHLKEITRSLNQLQPGFGSSLNLIPYRGDFSRGIIVSAYLECALDEAAARELYESYYRNHAFTHLSPVNIDLKQVVNTNKCLLYLERHGDKLMIISITDNLLKGASGQAVQNMNLLFALDEQTGLRLKPSAF
ncbi:N-acetyl-gamma-glutamyl-phosphate reductase [Anseongella ginsenosidimutans]|uniref:N-acetyl-gamma-glutamyl-phosphate reductase n=1 Tax=Anseongella ginsenosidimutans TaxID=496056 RepID=A0A4R3KVD4_9SPHI|nr:N-acetyl-gamma-glutamyl-phosphate reductase [Anseongella ginsenosidimutans]QEC51754.1 N-acetyl-gamma-glutamyl-phosphate reductase [Anseongella ginsenosidimutans]TCS89118.1 N-acetyl-gamma-glutamyl-phosphate reductase [Anseongella ginsenosidimutans]